MGSHISSTPSFLEFPMVSCGLKSIRALVMNGKELKGKRQGGICTFSSLDSKDASIITIS